MELNTTSWHYRLHEWAVRYAMGMPDCTVPRPKTWGSYAAEMVVYLPLYLWMGLYRSYYKAVTGGKVNILAYILGPALAFTLVVAMTIGPVEGRHAGLIFLGIANLLMWAIPWVERATQDVGLTVFSRLSAGLKTVTRRINPTITYKD
jgi:hypothetical protein